MRLPDAEKLGPPAVQLAGFEFWVHGRQFPARAGEPEPAPYDADWLVVTAHCAAPGARVWAAGALLTSSDLARWLDECEVLRDRLEGAAELRSYEPNVRVRLAGEGRTGAVTLTVDLTPDHTTQAHQFEFPIDQSYLPQLVDSLRAALHVYPVPPALCPR